MGKQSILISIMIILIVVSLVFLSFCVVLDTINKSNNSSVVEKAENEDAKYDLILTPNAGEKIYVTYGAVYDCEYVKIKGEMVIFKPIMEDYEIIIGVAMVSISRKKVV